MTLAAIVCCREKDAAMLPLFIAQWKEIYPDVPLWLANDAADPVRDTWDLALTESVQWGKGVGGSIVRAMLATGADIVAKVDVDGWHRRRYLFDPFYDSKIMASGIAWSNEPGRFLGIGYALRRETLAALEMSNACCDWLGSREDVAICHGVRRIWPNGVFLYPNKYCRRADTDPELASVVHCGIHGRDDDGRILAHAEMNYLANESPVVAVFNEVWLGMCIMPDRLASARYVLTRLLNNRVPPTGIIVAIPHLLKRTGQSYDETLLSEISAIDPRIKIVRCDDRGPITKYVELIRAVDNPKALCIVVDDDIDYSPQLIERMSCTYIASDCQVLANSVLKVRQGDWLVPEGWAGVAFLQGLIDLPHLEAFITITEQLPDAWLADDAVMGFYFDLIRAEVEVSLAPVFATSTAANFDPFALNKIGNGHIARYRLVIDWLRQNRKEILRQIPG